MNCNFDDKVGSDQIVYIRPDLDLQNKLFEIILQWKFFYSENFADCEVLNQFQNSLDIKVIKFNIFF